MPDTDSEFLFEDESPAAHAAPPEAQPPVPEGDSEFLFAEDPPHAAPPETPPVEDAPYTDVSAGDDIDPVTGLVVSKETPEESREILLPWMKFHEFVLVRTGQELEEIVDKAIAYGSCALDLETEGFDNRIDYDAEGKPYTIHKIVGVCLAVKGTGYYIPVRHEYNVTYDEPNPNVPPVQVEAALKRLCQASQPVLTPEGHADDPLGSPKIAEKGKVVIKFWNAKFDQEFLYPVTGVDYWHPSSFEDGLLLRYCIYTDDTLKLKDQAKMRLRVKDPATGQEHPYEMIRFGDLFPKGVKKKDMKIQTLHPLLDRNVTRYGCSDAICTEMLVDQAFAELKPLKQEFIYLVEKHVVQVIRQMERTRTKINRAAVAQVLEEAEKELLQLDSQIGELAKSKGFNDFNPKSPAQLSALLFSKEGLNIEPKPPMTGDGTSGQYKTDADTLETLLDENPNAPPVLQWILHYRQIQRIIGTYLNRFLSDCDKDDQLRFNFNQTGAATGRFTAPAGEPDHGFFGGPIQGIPARDDPKKPKVAGSLRRVFVAREGYTMVKADYAGQELRLVSNVSGEPLWVNEFLHGDGDLHSLTARAFFNIPDGQPVPKHQRTAGKCVHPGTLIYVDGQLKSIGELPFSEEDAFRDIRGPVTSDGERLHGITATYNGGTKSLVHVVTSGGIVTCTPSHRFKLRDGSFVSAGDLTEGTALFQPDLPQVQDARFYQDIQVSLWEGIPHSKFTPSHELSYFAGLYAGDGTGNASSACITHGTAEKIDAYGNPYEDWIRHLESSAAACGFTTTRKDFGSLYLGSRVFVRYLQALGMQRPAQKNLRIPPWVLRAGRTAILHYLGGLFDTDGTVAAEQHNLDWTTKDFVFAGQVAAAMRACGLDFNVELTFNKTYQRYYVRQRLTVESSWEMRHYLKHPGKLSRLREPRHPGIVKDRFIVTKVLPAGEDHCVDISVDESHVYLANGVVTHNTANFALVYGGGVQAVRRATGVDKVEAARQKAAFDASVPQFTRWLKGQHEKVKKTLGIRTAFGRWIAIPDANIRPGTFTLPSGKEIQVDVPTARKIQASCERKSVNYPIQGAGADVMKISLVRLFKEFYKRGWLKMNGDDSIRMLMTIHDEIVFEIRHDRLEEAIPLLCDVMSSPTQKLPAWKIPLIVEPDIGLDWSAKYKWPEIKEGKKPVPDWLVGYVTPGPSPEPSTSPAPQQEAPPPAPSATPSAAAAPQAPPTPPAKPAQEKTPAAPVVGKEKEEVAVFSISTILLTSRSVKILNAISLLASDDDGKVLRLTDEQGNILIDSSLKIRVNPDYFGYELRTRNLGPGTFEIVTA